MNSTGPWWGTAAVTFTGVLLTLAATVWIDYRKGRRETAFRWADRKIALYTHLARACRDSRDLTVWPESADETTQLETIRDDVGDIEYVAPPAVTRAASDALAAVEALFSHVRVIRTESTPGHQGAVAARFVEELSQLSEAVSTAVDAFVKISRADVDIKSKFAALSERPGS